MQVPDSLGGNQWNQLHAHIHMECRSLKMQNPLFEWCQWFHYTIGQNITQFQFNESRTGSNRTPSGGWMVTAT
jgi:hypothetical protein